MDLLKRNSYHLMIVLFLGISIQATSYSSSHPEFASAGWKCISFIASPVQKLFHESFETTKFVWSRYIWLTGLSEKSKLLELEIQNLKSERNKLLEFQSENQRLSGLLAYKATADFNGIISNVIGRDPSNWSMTITLDKGYNDGIEQGNPVIASAGLVGRVSAVGANYSTVLLLSDPSSSVGAVTQESRINGIIEGTFSNELLRLSFIEHQHAAKLKIGDRIVTSGMDSIFPKGIFIGHINEIKGYSGGLFQEITVKASVDLRRLETVMILINKSN
jgi:rod shape-determining protein MreC